MTKKENLFVIGDVHGCFHTFVKLLEHWDPKTELLIQVGDLINKGKHSPKVVRLARQLEKEHEAVFLKGNHEYQAIQQLHGKWSAFWEEYFFVKTLKHYELLGRSFEYDVEWFKEKPVVWSNDHLFISHAGVSHFNNIYELDNRYSILCNRSPLKQLKQFQIVGHTPTTGDPKLVEGHYLNIDTGAFKGQALSGVKITREAKILELISELTIMEDIF
ncbi:MAG: metallophosphoesterase [Saprospiraceae bacterium]|nr:metallophosphoesterase [Saprospiraceae bacterium]